MSSASRFSFFLLATIAFDVCLFTGLFGSLPDTAKLAQGIQLERRRSDGKFFSFIAGPRNKKYVHLSELPKHFLEAVLSLEDARFNQHYGFDVIQIQKVLTKIDDSARPRGASTITQQLAKNLYLTS